MVVVLALIDGALLFILGDAGAVVPDVEIPFVVLVAFFAVVEWRVIHVQFRAEASSFSLMEVPLVLGLLYHPPGALVLAAVVGVALGLSIGRHQSILKIAFNAANIALYTLVAALIVNLVPHGGVDRWIWLSLLGATVVGSILSVLSIVAAITLTEGAPTLRKVGELVRFGVTVSSANTAIGLTAGLLLSIDGYSLLLLGVPGLLVLGAYRMFASEKAQRERVEFLYRSTRSLDLGGSDDALLHLLDEARHMFRAEVGAVLLLGDDGQPDRLLSSAAGENGSKHWAGSYDSALTPEAVNSINDPLLASAGRDGIVRNLLKRVGARDAMVARLATEQRTIGLLLIANRLGEVTSFTGDDLQVLGALARQSAVHMHSDRLEHALIELRELERRLAHQATHDSLTGLPNRSLFNARLEEAAANTQSFAVLFIDLDDFKQVNDTHGHAGGDTLLIEVAGRMRALLRPVDVAARFGGDEFAILLRDHPHAGEVADRIVASLGRPFDLGGSAAQIGCSIGIATSGEGSDIEQLLQAADTAMYQAKQAGKNTVVHYSAAGASRPVRDLAQSTDGGCLELHYQPIIELATRRICGVEALVRLRSPDGRLVMPGDFIGKAERDGLIVPIDRWVLQQAAIDVSQIVRQADDDIFVSVNMSSRHLQTLDLVDWMQQPDLDGLRSRLVLELTETTLIDEFNRADSQIADLRCIGTRFALDSFGTGYSSIGYLREFDIDILKLAKPITDTLTVRSDRPPLMQTMIDLGRTLGFRLVAEGVEQADQLARLSDLGCDMAQGFHFARPMPIEDLKRLLHSRSALSTSPKVGADPLRFS